MANFQNDGGPFSFVAGTSLANAQNHVVAANGTANQVGLPSAAGIQPLGVLLNKPAAGAAAAVQHQGIAKVVSNGGDVSITVGGTVFASTDGKVYQRGTVANGARLGIALEASSADGTLIQVLLNPGA